MYDDDRNEYSAQSESANGEVNAGAASNIANHNIEKIRAAEAATVEPEVQRVTEGEPQALEAPVQQPQIHGWEPQHTQSQSQQPNYSQSYQQPQPDRVNMSHIPPDTKSHHRSERKPSMAGKVAGITAAALLFGVVAGGTMFGVNAAGEYLTGRSAAETQVPVKIGQAETQPDVTANAPAGGVVIPTAQNDVSAIVEQAMPSVVAINNTMLYQQQTWFGQSQTYEVPSSGSGIIVGQNAEELLIVTNNHVISDSKELSVTFINNTQVKAAIKGTDSENDLAVIAVSLSEIPADTMSQIKVATMGDSDSLKVGQGVIAIGNALGYGQSVTVGYVSAVDREVKADDQTSRNLLQTDAAINPGNSGGALLNMKGEVIGINAAKYSSTEVEGMGYAIPISKAQDIINDLMNLKTRVAVEEKNQGYLGIQGQNIDEAAASMYDMPKGIYVFKIVEGGAAEKSDLREKDIITKFDGQNVRSMQELKDMLTYYEGGSTITLTVQSLENGQYTERKVDVTLGYKPAAETN